MAKETRKRIVDAAWNTCRALADRDDAYLDAIIARSRLKLSDAYRSMDEYGIPFGPPPLGAYANADIIEVEGNHEEYALSVYLWGGDGKETDFSAELSMKIVDDEVLTEIDGLRVM